MEQIQIQRYRGDLRREQVVLIASWTEQTFGVVFCVWLWTRSSLIYKNEAPRPENETPGHGA